MGFLMTLVYSHRKISAKKAKKPNEHLSHSLTKKRLAKKIKKNILKKMCGLAHGKKWGGMTKRGEFFCKAVFYHTHQVFCAVGARPPRPATAVAARTAATARTAITGVVRLCNATRYIAFSSLSLAFSTQYIFC